MNSMITTNNVSNEEIMEFLKKFYNEFLSLKEEVHSFKNEMYSFREEMYSFKKEMYSFREEMYSFKTKTENQLFNINERIKLIDSKLDYHSSMLARQEEAVKEIQKDRKELKLGLTKSLLTVTGVLSGAIAIIVSFFTGKAIIYSVK